MKRVVLVAAVILAVISTGSACAETFRFPATARTAHGVPQVAIAFAVYPAVDCPGRWSVEYPAGFSFERGPNHGSLRGNPGKGSYNIAVKTDPCPIGSDYVLPGTTRWLKAVVY